MRTDYIDERDLDVVYALLMPANRLVCQLAEQTGLRVGDVLALRTADMRQRMTVREAKTGKGRRIYIPSDLYREIMAQAGKTWVFEGRPGSKTGHRTRQAVWRDIKRAQHAMRARDNYGPHSLRKCFAVRRYRETGSLSAVQKELQHSSPAVTALYALADQVGQQRKTRADRRRRAGRKKRQRPD